MLLKILSAKWRPFCPEGDELKAWCHKGKLPICQVYPGYFQEPHWKSVGLLEISRVIWQLWNYTRFSSPSVCAHLSIHSIDSAPTCSFNFSWVCKIDSELVHRLLITKRRNHIVSHDIICILVESLDFDHKLIHDICMDAFPVCVWTQVRSTRLC